MTWRLVTLACLGTLVLPLAGMRSALGQTLQLDEDFEDGNLDGWSSSGNDTAEIVTSPVRAGSRAVHMHLDPTDPDPKRTEITAGVAGRLDYDEEYWLGFSFRLGRWDAPHPSWATLFQLHAVPGNENWSGCVAGRNPVTVTLNAGAVGVAAVTAPYTGPPPVPGGAIATMVWEQPMQLDRWYDWVVRLKPSLTQGVLQVWLDGNLIYEQSGGNVDLIDDCGVEQEPWVYLKIGIYKEYTNTATEDLFYDEVRIFKGPDGFDLVRPGKNEPTDGGVPADGGAAEDAGAQDGAGNGADAAGVDAGVDAASDGDTGTDANADRDAVAGGDGGGTGGRALSGGGCGCGIAWPGRPGRALQGAAVALMLILVIGRSRGRPPARRGSGGTDPGRWPRHRARKNRCAR